MFTHVSIYVNSYIFIIIFQMEYTFNTKFIHPFTMIVSGSSGSGKTYFTKRMIQNNVDPTLKTIFWFYAEWQSGYADMPSNVQLIPGMPESLDKYLDTVVGEKAVVFDDLMADCVDNTMISDAFTKMRHHRNVSVVLLLQNLFCQGKVMRTVHLNAEYVVVFGCNRDKSQFSHFARQVEPHNSKHLMEAYVDATSKPFNHLLIDLKPLTPNPLRYRSNSLSHDGQIVYIISGL